MAARPGRSTRTPSAAARMRLPKSTVARAPGRTAESARKKASVAPSYARPPASSPSTAWGHRLRQRLRLGLDEFVVLRRRSGRETHGVFGVVNALPEP